MKQFDKVFKQSILLLLILLQALPGWATPVIPGGNDDGSPSAGETLKGQVIGQDSGQPVAGAKVHLVELNRATTCDEQGAFGFANVPRGTFTLGAHAEGYASYHGAVASPSLELITVMLAPDYHFEDEVSVTASGWAVSSLESPQQVDLVDAVEIRSQGAASIGEALRAVPGVAMVGTGDALGTPMVRGIVGNRVRVLSDGVPLNHQQFSARHSPNVDPMLADRIEVVKGPSSVLWGPEAMGGVINVIDAPLPAAGNREKTVHGEVSGGFFSNTSELFGRVEAEGALGAFGWRLAGIRRDAGDIETPAGTLAGTDYDEGSGTLTLGYTGGWGSVRLRGRHWANDVGFYRPEGFRLDLEDDLLATDLLVPLSAGDLEVLLSRQDNIRKAFPAPLAGIPGVNLELVTTTARGTFSHVQKGPWRGKIGVEYLDLDNSARAFGQLLPDYEGDNLAVMVFEEARLLKTRRQDLDRLTLSFGARWDTSNLMVPVDLSRDLPEGFEQRYANLSGSLGLVYRLNRQLALAANLGRGWRPPSAFELFADGIHGGISAIQLGNPDLVEETNLNTEVAVRYQSGHYRAEISAYRNDFDNYVYLANTGMIDIGSGLPILRYEQSDAVLDGFEVAVDAVPVETLRLGLAFSSVSSENESTGNRLPLTPPARLNAFGAVTRPALGPLISPMAELELVWVGDGEISGEDEPFGTPTDSYTLLHVKAGFRLLVPGGVLGLDLLVRNLFDTEYTDFLWPYKGFGVPNPGRDVRLMTSFAF